MITCYAFRAVPPFAQGLVRGVPAPMTRRVVRTRRSGCFRLPRLGISDEGGGVLERTMNGLVSRSRSRGHARWGTPSKSLATLAE